MSPLREAIVLPLIFLTVTLLGGIRMAASVEFAAPPLFALVLATILIGVLVRSGALAPERLVSAGRQDLANVNGVVVILALFAASAQAFNLAVPAAGLPLLLFDAFLLVLLVNTLVASPDATRVLRSLMVIFGAAFVLKFIVLAAISDPAQGRLNRVLQILLEGMTLGTLTQAPQHPAAGYVAFFTLLLFLIGLAALPRRRPPATSALVVKSESLEA